MTPVRYEFGDFQIDVTKRRLLRAGEPVALIAKAFDLLLALIEHRDRVLEKEELMQLVWPESIVEESNLTQNVFVLRKALGETPHDHRYIVTVPRRGYRFVADVREVAEEERVKITPPQFRARAIIEVSAVRSIAVLPFKQLHPQSEDEYLGLGLAAALITQFSNLRQLITRPTSSILKYAAPATDPLAAGRELGVEALLDGHVQKAQDRMRLTVAGKKREAQQLLAALQQPGAPHFVAPYYLALICAALGETDQAFAWMEQAVTARDENLPLLKVDPRVDGLRGDPRFDELLRRVELAR